MLLAVRALVVMAIVIGRAKAIVTAVTRKTRKHVNCNN